MVGQIIKKYRFFPKVIKKSHKQDIIFRFGPPQLYNPIQVSRLER